MNLNQPVQRILCYGDSNTWGWVPGSQGTQRYSVDERWPGMLQSLLGDGYQVIEDGLGARTTMFDDPRPEFPGRNGLQTLPAVLKVNWPLEIVILMLGTTDTKEMINATSQRIGQGMQKLVQMVKSLKSSALSAKPKILIIVPPIVDETAEFALTLFKGGTAKGKELVEVYKNIAAEEQVNYLDPTNEVRVDRTDGVHLNAEAHRKLAELIYRQLISRARAG